MIKKLFFVFTIFFLLIGALGAFTYVRIQNATSGAPPYGEPETSAPQKSALSWLTGWQRPEGPARVALQVGHYKNNELPQELHKLIGNTGASGGGKSEAQVNLAIAEETKKLLEPHGIIVEILPATVPVDYWADVFVSVHADGSLDSSKSGYKVAEPWRDMTGNADELVASIKKEYEIATQLDQDPNITRNMRGYYAFAWWRYDHSLHPMTTAAILETGFLSSPPDREIIVKKPQVSAQGLAEGIVTYLKSQQLL